MTEPKYLGDGLYFEDDGYQVKLHTLNGDTVYLDHSVLDTFMTRLADSRKLKITIEGGQLSKEYP